SRAHVRWPLRLARAARRSCVRRTRWCCAGGRACRCETRNDPTRPPAPADAAPAASRTPDRLPSSTGSPRGPSTSRCPARTSRGPPAARRNPAPAHPGSIPQAPAAADAPARPPAAASCRASAGARREGALAHPASCHPDRACRHCTPAAACIASTGVLQCRYSLEFHHAKGMTTMGLLVDGKWQDRWYDTESTGGRFERSASQFRNWVTPDGSAGPSGQGGFKAESGRYHLYASYACPWAHRTLVMRAWKGLEKHIDVSVVHPLMLENGWEFRTDFEGATGDRLYGLDKLYQLYLKADPHYSGRVTVPTLWDKQRETVVNNESSEIIRMLGAAFDGIGARPGDYCPDDLRADIDAMNATVYDNVNNGVYRAGFATSQQAYDEAVAALFETLESLERRLGEHRYL